MKIAVYTAIFGDKDILRDPINYQEDENIDYFLFTDNPLIESTIYIKLLKPILFKDITKNARYYKIIGAPELEEYDYTIWHDGNLQVRSDKIYELIKYLKDYDLATFKHPHRNCIYKESIACIKRKKDNPSIIFNQISKYFKDGMPREFGLFETSILVRKQKELNRHFFSLWWQEIENHSRRDQIPFSYNIRNNTIKVGLIPGSREANDFSIFNRHQYSEYKIANVNEQKYSQVKSLIFRLVTIIYYYLR